MVVVIPPTMLAYRTISLISLFKSSLSLDITLLLGALIALSALIFIIVGCKLESKYKSKDIKPVVILVHLMQQLWEQLAY